MSLIIIIIILKIKIIIKIISIIISIIIIIFRIKILTFNVDIDALFLAALWLSHWARGCGLVEQPTASSRFGSTGVLWV